MRNIYIYIYIVKRGVAGDANYHTTVVINEDNEFCVMSL